MVAQPRFVGLLDAVADVFGQTRFIGPAQCREGDGLPGPIDGDGFEGWLECQGFRDRAGEAIGMVGNIPVVVLVRIAH